MEFPTTDVIRGYVADFRDFLKEWIFPERKAIIEVVGDNATVTYTIPMPSEGVTSESASVLDFVKSGLPFTLIA